MVPRSEGRIHTLTLRDVKLEDAGEVQLRAKDFKTHANLFVKGNYKVYFQKRGIMWRFINNVNSQFSFYD